jgi:hypothetical protein
MNSSPVHLILHVINQCCGSRMFIPDPDFYPPDPGSRIPDPAAKRKEEGKKFVFLPFFCSHKFHKIPNYLIFEQIQKKFEPFNEELCYFLPEELSLSSRKYGLWILCPEITYP